MPTVETDVEETLMDCPEFCAIVQPPVPILTILKTDPSGADVGNVKVTREELLTIYIEPHDIACDVVVTVVVSGFPDIVINKVDPLNAVVIPCNPVSKLNAGAPEEEPIRNPPNDALGS